MNRNNALKKLVLAALFVALDLLFTRVFCIYLMGGAERVSLQTLASAVGEDPGTLEDVYEPYLLQCGLMIRTPQGRQATLRTFEHLGIEPTV